MRLIDADALKKWVDDSISQYGNQYSTDMLNMFGLFKEVIDNAPTITNEQDAFAFIERLLESKNGKWEQIGEFGIAYRCSCCGEISIVTSRFCCHCGAFMIQEQL